MLLKCIKCIQGNIHPFHSRCQRSNSNVSNYPSLNTTLSERSQEGAKPFASEEGQNNMGQK